MDGNCLDWTEMALTVLDRTWMEWNGLGLIGMNWYGLGLTGSKSDPKATLISPKNGHVLIPKRPKSGS